MLSGASGHAGDIITKPTTCDMGGPSLTMIQEVADVAATSSQLLISYSHSFFIGQH